MLPPGPGEPQRGGLRRSDPEAGGLGGGLPLHPGEVRHIHPHGQGHDVHRQRVRPAGAGDHRPAGTGQHAPAGPDGAVAGGRAPHRLPGRAGGGGDRGRAAPPPPPPCAGGGGGGGGGGGLSPRSCPPGPHPAAPPPRMVPPAGGRPDLGELFCTSAPPGFLGPRGLSALCFQDVVIGDRLTTWRPGTGRRGRRRRRSARPPAGLPPCRHRSRSWPPGSCRRCRRRSRRCLGR